ncbi:MAG: hypothetical protein AAGJ93_10935, partial [Bacteroidota bacterium]
SESDRNNLKREYVTNIFETLALPKNHLEQLLALPNKEMLAGLEKMIASKGGEKAHNNSLQCLKVLIKHYESELDTNPDPVPIDKALQIDESHDNSTIIKQVDIYLNDLPYDDYVVLVDLPGLGSNNIRHEQITRDIAFQSATKSFVFVFAATGTANGELEDFIISLNNEKLPISDSFWVINKWTEQAASEQVQENFFRDWRKRQVKIQSDRFFTIPYSEQLLEDPNFVRKVELFKEQLFSFLMRQAQREFLGKAENLYQRISSKIGTALVKTELPKNVDDDVYIFNESSKYFDHWISLLEFTIDSALKKAFKNADLPAFDLLKTPDIEQIGVEIEQQFDLDEAAELVLLSRLVKQSVNTPDFVNILREVLNKVDPAQLVREHLQSDTAQALIHELFQPFTALTNQTIAIGSKQLPLSDFIHRRLEEIINVNSILFRIDGVVDAVYVQVVDELIVFLAEKFLTEFINGSTTEATDNTNTTPAISSGVYEERTKAILQEIPRYIVRYLKDKQTNVNLQLRNTQQTHFKYVKSRLDQLLREESFRSTVRMMIMEIVRADAAHYLDLDDAKKKIDAIHELQSLVAKREPNLSHT